MSSMMKSEQKFRLTAMISFENECIDNSMQPTLNVYIVITPLKLNYDRIEN